MKLNISRELECGIREGLDCEEEEERELVKVNEEMVVKHWKK